MNHVCPECGNEIFKQRLIRALDVEYVVVNGILITTGDEDIIDEDGCDDELHCTDCGATFADEGELITEDEYNNPQELST